VGEAVVKVVGELKYNGFRIRFKSDTTMAKHLSLIVVFIFFGCSEQYWHNRHLQDTYGNYDQTLEDLSISIEHDPENSALYLERARLFRGLGENTYAETDLGRAIELDPALAEAYYLRGIIRFERSFTQPEERAGAQSDMDKAVALGYENCEVLANRGFQKDLFVKDYQGAYDEYSRAIEIDSECARAYYGRASVEYYHLEKTDEALTDLAEAKQLYRKQGDREGYRETEELVSFIDEMKSTDKLLNFLNKME